MKYPKRVGLLAAFITFVLLILLFNFFDKSQRDFDLAEMSQFEGAMAEIDDRLREMKDAVDKIDFAPRFPEVKTVTETRIPHTDRPQILETKKYKTLKFPCKPLRSNNVTLNSKRMMDVYDEIKFDNIDGGVWKQGWDVNYDQSTFSAEHQLEVFVVPHSHNDPGWIKTFWDYYTSQTRNILNNIVDSLAENEHRKFIWAEISYLDLWWNEQTEDRKETFKRLVANGQLEITTAGWVMNDEANTHYTSMIDQLFEGHEWVREFVSTKFMPRTSWCIDPFGTSPTMAFILNRAGIPNLVMQRVHYEVKKYLAQRKHLEFPWRQSWAVGMQDDSTDTFTHLFPFYSYDIPHTCGPDPKVCCQFDFKRIPGQKLTCPWGVNAQLITEGNVAERASTLIDQYKKHSSLYSTNKLLIILGDDFRYETSEECRLQFQNYERLFTFINGNKEMNTHIKWGTLTDYFLALDRERTRSTELSANFHPISGDFFTYADRLNHYWSGYYTSRPFYKEMDRELRSHLRAAEIFFSLARIQDTKRMEGMYDLLVTSRRNAALFQHHDGVTGTAKTFVNNDYGEKMLVSLKNCQNIIAQSVQLLLGEGARESLIFDVDEYRIGQDTLPKRLIIEMGKDDRNVVFVNSLAHPRSELVSVRVSHAYLSVLNPSREKIPAQIAPAFDFRDKLRSDSFDLYFEVSIPPLGASKYTIVRKDRGFSQVMFSELFMHNHDKFQTEFFQSEQMKQSEIKMENSYITVTLDRNQGTLRKIESADFRTEVTVEFLTYGTNSNEKDDRSGAYLFIPNGHARTIRDMDTPSLFMIRGGLISKVCARFAYLTHCTSLTHTQTMDAHTVQFENFVSGIGDNEEVVMRLKTSVLSKGENYYYTDLNGFTMQRRKYYDKLTIQGNFYPMPTLAYIQNQHTRVSLHSKQSLGVGSVENGWMEVMLDRRPASDDNRGLEQGVTDNKDTIEKFRLLVEFSPQGFKDPNAELSFPSLLSHFVRESLQNPIFKLISKPSITDFSRNGQFEFSALSTPLPCDIHLVNLRAMKQLESAANTESAFMLHKFLFDCELPTKRMPGDYCSNHGEKGVDLTKLFSNIRLVEIKHMSLTLLQEVEPKEISSLATFDDMDIKAFKLIFAAAGNAP